MKYGNTRRTAALAFTAAVTLGAGLLFAGPAGAVDRVGGPGCSTNGVTLYQGWGATSGACYAGTAGTIGDNVKGIGSVKGVWNQGYAQYYLPSGEADVTGFSANGVHYKYDAEWCDNFSVTILS